MKTKTKTKEKAKDPRFPRTIGVEGNKGGSYISITELREGVILLEVGHDCVFMLRKEISVWALAAALSAIGNDGFRKLATDFYQGSVDPLPSWAEPA